MNYTEFADHRLWYDGDVTVDADKLTDVLLKGDVSVSNLFVDKMTKEVEQYNLFSSPAQRIRVKTECKPLSKEWNIPEQYKNLDIEQAIFDRLTKEFDYNEFSLEEQEERMVRVAAELQLYKKKNLYDVLRTIFYIINTLDEKGAVWGVGRGSSVSSYVLYLIGTHDVDSVKYCLDIHDFIS